MKKYIFSILAVSALVIAACNKELPENEQVAPEEPGVEYEFTASIDENTPETSASIDFASTGKVTWVDTDKIAVWTVWDASTKGFVEFSVKSISEDRKTATFATTFTDTPTSFGNAYYPASIAGSSENSIVLPSIYTSVADAADGFPMMSSSAVTPGQPVTFKHLGSFLKLTLTGLPSGSSSLDVVASGASLAGTFTTALDNDNNPTLTVSSGTASVTVPVTSGDNTVYLPVPAGTYGFEIRVKNSTGRYLFRKEASSRTFYRAILKALKSLAYVAPSKYYVKTVSAYEYWNRVGVRMIQTGASTYVLSENCSGNTTYYIYDEYNVDQPSTGYIASGLAKPAFVSGVSEWGVVGYVNGNNFDLSNPVSMQYEGDWHFVKNVTFDNIAEDNNGTYTHFLILKGSNWDNVVKWGGVDIYPGVYGATATQGASWDIYPKTITADTEYDIFFNIITHEVRLFLSSANHDPNEASGVWQFSFNSSSEEASHVRKSDIKDDPFGDSSFPKSDYGFKSSVDGWAAVHNSETSYDNYSWIIPDISVGSDGTYNFGLCNGSSDFWTDISTDNTFATVNPGSNLYGTLTYWRDNGHSNPSISLTAGTYIIYVNVNPDVNGGVNVMFEKQ